MIALLFFIVLMLWCVTPWAVSRFFPDPGRQGQFGDLFGSINALFSGLAFAGVVVAIFLQRHELKLQHSELAESRRELQRSATAQENLQKAQQKAINAQAYKVAVDVLQAESVVRSRGIVFSHLANKPMANWTDEEFAAAETVCRTYDVVGIMVKHDMLPVEVITDSWGTSLRQAWPILNPLITKHRVDRDAPKFWDNFEMLAIDAANRKADAAV
jgi:hypothetical protein